MIKLMFYSYKGGTGRTTGTANVAAALAKHGKNVLCIDMDLEAPGLHTVFGIDKPTEAALWRYLQPGTITSLPIGLEALRSHILDATQELAGPEIRANVRILQESGQLGKLHLLPAAPAGEAIHLEGVEPFRRMQKFCSDIASEYDFVIFDSASGLRDLSALAMYICDLIVIFFRWGWQSVKGTSEFARFLKRQRDMDEADFRAFVLVASAVPDLSILSNADRETCQSQVTIYSRLLERHVKEAGEEFFLNQIKELMDLKWLERIIVFDDLKRETDFDKLAEYLVKRVEKCLSKQTGLI